MSGRPFHVAELTAYRAGSTPGGVRGWGTRARMTPAPLLPPLESTDTYRVSDLGWRDGATGALYPPMLASAFEMDRRLPLAPSGAVAGAAWGRLRLLNPDGRWDAIAATRSPDGRAVRILRGQKIWDQARGIETDPAAAMLATVFAGIAQGWFLSEAALEVPLRDATYWIERPLQSTLYLGSGGYEGTADLAGRPKPKARGGTAAQPIRNVTPVLVDPTARIYQYTDGPGTVVALYEGGATGIGYAGDTTDLYAGSTPPGQYRTDNGRGLFQLGSTPARPITVDVTGAFPSAGTKTTAAQIARYLLTEDMALPVDMIDIASFDAVDAAYPYLAGWWYAAEQVDGAAALGPLLRALGAMLLPGRDGRLRIIALRALAADAAAVATLTEAQIVDCRPRELGPPLDPPPFRWQVGFQRNATVQTSDLSPLADEARRQFLAAAWRYAGWSGSAVLLAYRRPSDPPPVETALLVQADAASLAQALGALWGVRRRLYDVTLPAEIGLAREIGDVVRLFYPMDDLRGGRLGQVVGEQYRAGDAVATVQVLV